MYADQFEVRIARVRHRFATSLESKIAAALVLADGMAGDRNSDSKLVSECYRGLHSICGIGPTVGFAATGEAARAAEITLLQAMGEQRRPTEMEIANLKEALGQLRTIAASELRVMYQQGR
jgi:hypothetical protein